MGQTLRTEADGERIVVVGVVADVRGYGTEVEARPVLYRPQPQRLRPTMSHCVRTRGEPELYSATVRDAIWRVAGRTGRREHCSMDC